MPTLPTLHAMDAYEKALSRAAGYTLLGRLFGAALTPALHAELAAVPGLSASLPAPYDADEAAVAYQTLFGFNIFPFEGVFVDAEALLGGAAADTVRRHYHASQFTEGAATDQPDHLSTELHFLGHLSRLEAQARSADQLLRCARIEEAAARFLDEHLLRWLPPLAEALARAEAPLYTAAARLALDLAQDHRRSLRLPFAPLPALPAAPDVLDDPRAGVREIAGFLTRPAWCGLFLSRTDIQRLGRRDALPAGFGDRVLLLANLFRSASTFDRLQPLLEGLHTVLDHAHDFHTEYLLAPTPADDPWLARIDRTKAVLDGIAQALAEADTP